MNSRTNLNVSLVFIQTINIVERNFFLKLHFLTIYLFFRGVRGNEVQRPKSLQILPPCLLPTRHPCCHGEFRTSFAFPVFSFCQSSKSVFLFFFVLQLLPLPIYHHDGHTTWYNLVQLVVTLTSKLYQWEKNLITTPKSPSLGTKCLSKSAQEAIGEIQTIFKKSYGFFSLQNLISNS